MPIFMAVLFVCAAGGLIILIYSARGLFKSEAGRAAGGTVAEAAESRTDAVLDETDRAMEELDKQAKAIFEELDNKYQELLFLYNMIDAKAAEAGLKPARTDVIVGGNEEAAGADGGAGVRVYTNPNLAKIKELAGQGRSAAEIAKELNMGQGEVQMIQNLDKYGA
ncbi:MAG: hypothetical protein FWF44_04000 [Defluviitaleaceae bacterium]|nr:hypothetical protein [Defluviitaleaceae bacterium]